jgi:ParB family chromosome partitioning protein
MLMLNNKATGKLTLTKPYCMNNSNIVRAINESVIHAPLCELYPPEFHPFMVNDDGTMTNLVESIKHYGVREPGIARPRTDGGYELLCGNRRKRASELNGLSTMPVIIRALDDEQAVIIMVESNLHQREKILPSERAWAYRVMMEALNHNGVKGESHSYELMVERTGVKKSQLFRFIRLSELIAALSDKVDKNQLAFNPAVELSYLSVKEQSEVVEAMTRHEIKPSLSQAVRLKKLKQDGKLTLDMIDKILSEVKKPQLDESESIVKYRKYFPPEFSQRQMDHVILKLLKNWKAGITA